jgi:hypothetical protein
MRCEDSKCRDQEQPERKDEELLQTSDWPKIPQGLRSPEELIRGNIRINDTTAVQKSDF